MILRVMGSVSGTVSQAIVKRLVRGGVSEAVIVIENN